MINASRYQHLAIAVGLGFILLGCQPKEAPVSVTETSTPPAQVQADSSKTALDWPGQYSGTLPCASCEGIKTIITLNPDDQYVINATYLGSNTEPFSEKGKFSWNAAGNIIKLANGNQYLVGENRLLMLDNDAKQVTGDLASFYELKKLTP
ncbi:MAG: copper resistance protein NlpE [Shewanella sp.]